MFYPINFIKLIEKIENNYFNILKLQSEFIGLILYNITNKILK
jgi:hypothetical protein